MSLFAVNCCSGGATLGSTATAGAVVDETVVDETEVTVGTAIFSFGFAVVDNTIGAAGGNIDVVMKGCGGCEMIGAASVGAVGKEEAVSTAAS
jgi:hypothetical protein